MQRDERWLVKRKRAAGAKTCPTEILLGKNERLMMVVVMMMMMMVVDWIYE